MIEISPARRATAPRRRAVAPKARSSASGAALDALYCDRARAATRAFELLDFFSSIGRPARTAEIARALQMPSSSADDLLRALRAQGYLGFDTKTKLYSPSYSLVRVSERFLFGFPLLAQIHNLEQSLFQETGQTVVVVVQEDTMLRIVSVTEGQHLDSAVTQVGRTRPLALFDRQNGWMPSSNFAGALLAANSDLEIVTLLSKLEQPGRLTDFNRLLDRVRKIRALGVSGCTEDGVSHASYAGWLKRLTGMPALAIGYVSEPTVVDHWRGQLTAAIWQRRAPA